MSSKIERDFVFIDGKYIPLVKVFLDPCEADDNAAWEERNLLAGRIEQMIAAPVVERQPVAWVYKHKDQSEFGEPHTRLDFASEMLDNMRTGKRGESGNVIWHPREDLFDWVPLFASPPAPVAVAVTQYPFADKVIRKLRRFQSCAEDGQGADIGRHWFDLLTQLGLLNRVQRSPALWEITQQGEDCLQKTKEDE